MKRRSKRWDACATGLCRNEKCCMDQASLFVRSFELTGPSRKWPSFAPLGAWLRGGKTGISIRLIYRFLATCQDIMGVRPRAGDDSLTPEL